MITNYPVLRQMMKEHKIKDKELAAIIGVSRIAFYMKLLGFKRWNLTEVVNICCFFRTPDAERMFLRNNNKQQ